MCVGLHQLHTKLYLYRRICSSRSIRHLSQHKLAMTLYNVINMQLTLLVHPPHPLPHPQGTEEHHNSYLAACIVHIKVGH